MKTHQGIRVSSSTAGSPTPGFEHLSGGYHFQRDPTWTPNDPRYRETIPAPSTAGGSAIRKVREGRIAKFAGILADLDYPDPRDAPPSAVREAGKRVGVGWKTARSYRAALLKQQQETAP